MAVVVAACLAAPACGSEIVVGEHAGTTSGSGGASSASVGSGSGGANGSASVGSVGGGTAGAGGAALADCSACSDQEYCAWSPAGACGPPAIGTCQPKPDGCLDDCPGVCGCDGNFYCNACDAAAAGVSTGGETCAFTDTGAVYTAFYRPWGIPHVRLFKADPVANLCLMISVWDSGGGWAGLQINTGWGVDQIFISDRAADCGVKSDGSLIASGSDFSGPMAMTGVYTLDSPTHPCAVSVHATVTFPPGAPWVPASDQVDVDGVKVIGDGCP